MARGRPKIIITLAVIVILLFLFSLWAFPMYNVWRKELRGKADLKEAEWGRQIAIEEAKARKESAVLDAEAEIERAKGVAEANQIIGNSLKDNEAYLRYLWIHGLHDGSSEVIYVPTEANLPILEATRQVQ
ncbi:hypothetical protein KY338_06420 [Candidatus Woesearchaeota archaeon]|nr:hypothetical protein [Candidatus Woesearchaeota archaeon]MBW3006457.1 hypothetical protein [Candidatus Woesearchaeota archaeon]